MSDKIVDEVRRRMELDFILFLVVVLLAVFMWFAIGYIEAVKNGCAEYTMNPETGETNWGWKDD